MDKLHAIEPQAVKRPSLPFKSRNVIIIVLLLALLSTSLSTIYLYLKDKKHNIEQNLPSTPTANPQAVILPENREVEATRCTETECLIAQDYSHYGYATIKGYYKQYEGTQWEWFNEEVFCDGMVVTGGNTTIIQEFRDMAEGGNTLNKIIDNELIVNIDLSSLTDKEKEFILNSSITSPVEISFTKRVPRGTGVSTCFSLIDIFSIQ